MAAVGDLEADAGSVDGPEEAPVDTPAGEGCSGSGERRPVHGRVDAEGAFRAGAAERH